MPKNNTILATGGAGFIGSAVIRHTPSNAESLISKSAPKENFGQTYNIGALNEKRDIDVAHITCDLLEEIAAANENAKQNGKGLNELIIFVSERPNHNFCYAIDASRIQNDLERAPEEGLETGIQKTVQ